MNNNRNDLLLKFKKGLNKTSNFIRSGFSIFSGNKKKLDEEEMERLERVLIESDLGVNLSFSLVEEIRDKGKWESLHEVKAFLKNRLLQEFPDIQREIKTGDSPRVILFIGINGAGKTTSIAKIGAFLKGKQKNVLLAASDTFRAAASEQLAIWAERLQFPIVKHKMGSDPAAVAHDACERAKARNMDYVLIDSAGRLHNQNALMEELKKIVRVIKSKIGDHLETLLVLDGNTGQNGFIQAKAFKEEIGVDGIIITKLDGTAKGGIVVSVEKELKIPVKFIGVGEGIEDLVPFDPELFVESILED